MQVDRFNGREDENFSMWSWIIFSVIRGKRLAGAVTGSEIVPCKSDIEVYNLYQEKVSLARDLLFTSLSDKPLRAVQSA